MNGLQAIQDRILAEAREAAAQIIEQTEGRLAEIDAAAEAEASQLLAEARRSAESQAEAIMNRARSQAAMGGRKDILQTRQDLIDQAIARAGDMICRLPDQVKVAFYRNLLRQTGAEAGEVVLPAADRHLAGGLLADSTGQYTLAADDGAFACGLILRRDRIEDNMTLDLMIANNRQNLVQVAAGVLFDPAAES